MTNPGKVYLVGAGPGNIEYLTVKAYRILEIAEVLIYDALVDGELLNIVPDNCLKLNVGKRGGEPSTSQTEINGLLVEYCLQGKRVIRLKSGDPLIFGRCILEIEALKQAGCNFEIIPGISSALAAPLLAGIPLTDPVLSRCFLVCTGHDTNELNWQVLSSLETLVILMGGKNLDEIIYQLRKYQKPEFTPIAIIRWAGTDCQQIWVGEISNIIEKTAGLSLSPSVIIVGEVVKLRNFII